EVDQAINGSPGTLMKGVNLIFGCAARKSTPGIALAVLEDYWSGMVGSRFSGGNTKRTTGSRSYFARVGPYSAPIMLLKNGKLVYMMERQQIEGRGPDQIAEELKRAFQEHCTEAAVSTS